jgi:tagaturonate epimerase
MSDAIQSAAATLGDVTVYPRSTVVVRDATCFLGRRPDGSKTLGIVDARPAVLDRFDGQATPVTWEGRQTVAKLAPLTAANAAALRELLPFLAPRTLGLQQSAGCGDRLGLATPGHLRAFRRSKLAPILAQQSIRENTRTGRTPQSVVDDAMWGVFQEGWRDGYGADADHLKAAADLTRCAEAGYTFFTIDPSEHVDNAANTAGAAALGEKIAALPWRELETSWEDTRARLGRRVDLGSFALEPSEEALQRATAKYARVVLHTAAMHRHLQQVCAGRPFELEMSVDESDTVTSIEEHVYIATELRRLGVSWVSLAPRYVGTFEKGVDYIGDLAAFEQSFAGHVAVARALGPYKLSLHSGSDKFSIFPIAARLAGKSVHLKTSGTSWLEALRTAARVDPELFREIVALACERYPADRASYHVSADVSRMPEVKGRSAEALAAVLDDFDAREILHVTFGSVISNPRLRERLLAAIRSHEERYFEALEKHFARHFAPFD